MDTFIYRLNVSNHDLDQDLYRIETIATSLNSLGIKRGEFLKFTYELALSHFTTQYGEGQLAINELTNQFKVADLPYSDQVEIGIVPRESYQAVIVHSAMMHGMVVSILNRNSDLGFRAMIAYLGMYEWFGSDILHLTLIKLLRIVEGSLSIIGRLVISESTILPTIIIPQGTNGDWQDMFSMIGPVIDVEYTSICESCKVENHIGEMHIVTAECLLCLAEDQ